MLTDVVGFGARIRNDDDRLIIRRSLHVMTGAVLGELEGSCPAHQARPGIAH